MVAVEASVDELQQAIRDLLTEQRRMSSAIDRLVELAEERTAIERREEERKDAKEERSAARKHQLWEKVKLPFYVALMLLAVEAIRAVAALLSAYL